MFVPAAVAGQTCTPNDGERQCMVCNCFFETRGEKVAGKTAVNIVVHARANSDQFPNSVCKVVWQKSQFSWTADKNSNTMNLSNQGDQQALKECQQAADTTFRYKDRFHNPTHYHNTSVKPKWAGKFPILFAYRQGNHIFYNDMREPSLKAPTLTELAKVFNGVSIPTFTSVVSVENKTSTFSQSGASQ